MERPTCSPTSLANAGVGFVGVLAASDSQMETTQLNDESRLYVRNTPRFAHAKPFIGASFMALGLTLAGSGCATGGDAPDAGVRDGGPVHDVGAHDTALLGEFACSELAPTTSMRFCADFNDSRATGWTSQAGTWVVRDRRYLGAGPDFAPLECEASGVGSSLVDRFSATDVRIQADLQSIIGVDKVIVLRHTDASNRIEINLRAEFEFPHMSGMFINDLMVTELSGDGVTCTQTLHTEENEILVTHRIGETIRIDLELVGNHLRVLADEVLVVDRDFEFANTAGGRVGVGHWQIASGSWDSFVATSLDPSPGG